MRQSGDLYDTDFYQWTQAQAALLRDRKAQGLDYANLAEEIESLGKSQYRELGSRLDVLVMHLLKWGWQPTGHQTGHSWRATIRTQRRELRRLLQQNPSLRPLVTSVLADSYADARLDASDETGIPLTSFPETCPWTPAQVLDAEFWPDAETPPPRRMGFNADEV